ncbi:MAG: lipopolysaccharide biosynthesis protein [Geminicoccaceae bacterium]
MSDLPEPRRDGAAVLPRRAARGAMWATVEVWGNEALQFVMFAILAKLLGPEAYGILGLALIFVLAGQTVIIAGGWMEAIIQRQDLRSDHLDSIFYFVCGLAMALAIGATAGAGWVADLFDEPMLGQVIPWLALALPIASFNVVPLGLLQRELRLAPLAVRGTVGVSVAGLVAITMALAGWGVWSLVAYELIQPLVGVVVFWTAQRWRPGVRFSWGALAEIAGYSARISGERIVMLGENLVPRIATGRLLGTASVGFWTLARKIFDFSAELVQRPAMRVAMPMFARAQSQPRALADMLKLSIELTALAAIPGYVLMLTLSPDLVLLLFGEPWLPAATLLQVLAVAGLFMPAQQLLAVLTQAVGRPGASLAAALLGFLILLVGMVALSPWGLAGIAAAYVLRTLGLVVLRALYLRQTLGLPLLRVFAGVPPLAGAGALMLGTVIAVEQAMGSGSPSVLDVAAQVLAGSGAYLLGLGLLARPLLRRCVAFARTALAPSPAAA